MNSNEMVSLSHLKVQIEELDKEIEKGEIAKERKKAYLIVMEDIERLKKNGQNPQSNLSIKEVYLNILKENNAPISADGILDIISSLGMNIKKPTHQAYLSKLTREGSVRRVSLGIYALA